MKRRLFVKRVLAAAGAAVLAPAAVRELVLGERDESLRIGFANDAPEHLDRFSRPAAWARELGGDLVQCVLCPHECVLGENDRGLCRTRAVKGGRLHTLAYGNLCTARVDPIEKKPFFHFLPGTQITSVAIGGCNLRCLNCQNWEISQKRPADVAEETMFPDELVAGTAATSIPSIAYTYSEPLVAYEYVRDTAARARDRGLRNALVTAGFVSPRPLRELCRSLDAVTLDLKAFDPARFRRISSGRVEPVLRALEVLREEGVWIEVSFLMVPTLSDSPSEIAAFAAWARRSLGRHTPLHILRFHPAHRLTSLPPTPVAAMEQARDRAREAGLDYVYLGNVPGHDANHTRCPRCARMLVERRGYAVTRLEIADGRCPCGERIAGVFA